MQTIFFKTKKKYTFVFTRIVDVIDMNYEKM